jgi:hypothetical protein
MMGRYLYPTLIECHLALIVSASLWPIQFHSSYHCCDRRAVRARGSSRLIQKNVRHLSASIGIRTCLIGCRRRKAHMLVDRGGPFGCGGGGMWRIAVQYRPPSFDIRRSRQLLLVRTRADGYCEVLCRCEGVCDVLARNCRPRVQSHVRRPRPWWHCRLQVGQDTSMFMSAAGLVRVPKSWPRGGRQCKQTVCRIAANLAFSSAAFDVFPHAPTRSLPLLARSRLHQRRNILRVHKRLSHTLRGRDASTT